MPICVLPYVFILLHTRWMKLLLCTVNNSFAVSVFCFPWPNREERPPYPNAYIAKITGFSVISCKKLNVFSVH
jgi:hypothetical protein